MKAKLKLSPDHFCFLVNIVQYSFSEIDYQVKPMQYLNLQSFLRYGQKKVIDLKDTYKMMMPRKEKTFTIDINQFVALLFLFKELEFKDELDSYGIALYETIKQQSRPMNLN